MKTGLLFLVSVCMYVVAANTLRTNKTHRDVVVNQLCQHSGANTLKEITTQLKKDFETLKKELTQQLIKMNKKDNGGISNGTNCSCLKLLLFSFLFSVFQFFGLQTWRTRGNKYEHIDNKTDKIYNSMLSDILSYPVRNCRQKPWIARFSYARQ